MPALPLALWLSLLGGLLAGCHRPPAAQHQFTASTLAGPAATARPEMVFLSFKATAVANGPATITLLKSTVAAGAPKAAPAGASEMPDYLTIAQLGASREVLSSTAVEHPLRRAVETAGAEGQLRRQEVSLPEAEFFVRMTLAATTKTVRVEEFVNRRSVKTTDFTLPARP
ncbi:hypothetical protein [Hymenobacter jeollabukensis]|uniref:DUF4426 domain-containing protein n=1 Tax=Hymenobacter jeollabukensis TaxID=2025313 RepID=A0A5R8WVK1_9BACT|nr:hypothetical protein [Hymenobacter jeollabukensis]TLM96537.1 hypothetical protein FDY95_00640 [Hymenobacter jeollabukensis]